MITISEDEESAESIGSWVKKEIKENAKDQDKRGGQRMGRAKRRT